MDGNPHNLRPGDLAIVGGTAARELHGTIVRIKRIDNGYDKVLHYHAVIVEGSPYGGRKSGDLNGKLRNLTPRFSYEDNESALRLLKGVENDAKGIGRFVDLSV